jgi:SAM-dependent methyltransferase
MNINLENNIGYLKEHYNKFIYPKPVEDIQKEIIDKKSHYYTDPTYYWHKIWPEKKFSLNKLSILVAGCGTNQAAVLAMQNPHHEIVGVDLSSNSIEHHKKLIKKHGIKNIKVFCDDFRKINFNEKFDYIISSGVIHHLDDPNTALKYFYENIKDDGVISIMVYGNKVIGPLNDLKKIFFKIGLDQDQKSIDLIKEFFNNFNQDHPASIFYNKSGDIKFDAGIVDFILHKSEKFYAIKDFIKILDDNNLIIKNFHDANIQSLTKYFLSTPELLEKVRSLSIEDQLEFGQVLNWNDHRISVFCSKKNNFKKSFIYYRPNIEDLFICYRDGTSYEISDNNFMIRLESGEKYYFNVMINDSVIWNLVFSGKMKLDKLFSMYPTSKHGAIKDFFLILIENNFIDSSLHNIEVNRL